MVFAGLNLKFIFGPKSRSEGLTFAKKQLPRANSMSTNIPSKLPESPKAPANSNTAIWPRITLVTAVYNGANYLEATIQSILAQNYPNLEYIIVDDGSTDNTVEIIGRYEQHMTCWFSQANQGLYAALNAGYARSTGEIMGWLNSSDQLHPNGLFVVGTVFAKFAEVEWITGRPTVFSPEGITVEVQPLPRWSRMRFLAGANRHIQQESTYWRRSLWERAGGALNTAYRAEGDFEQWVRFFRHARLYSVDALIGGYRRHLDALSWGNIDRYNQKCDEIVEAELRTMDGARFAKLFRGITRAVKPIPKVRGLWQRLAVRGLHKLSGPDLPPVIYDHGEGWTFRK
jgi:glycosyltransferase involved in cell wall biosynthesis